MKLQPFQYPLRQAAGALVLGLVLGTIGPFGTFGGLAAGPRYFYWLSIVAANWLQIVLCLELVARLPGSRDWPLVAQAVAAALLAAVPATFEVLALEAWLRDPQIVAHNDFIGFYGYVALVSVAVAVPMTLLLSRGPVESQPAPGAAAPGPPPRPAFLRRLPPELGEELICLAMEDHYLRVHMGRGDTLVLMRLRDALEELNGADGMQVHRSYWVARDAVTGSARDGRRVRLRLKNGLEVPVSRTYLPAVRKAGWV